MKYILALLLLLLTNAANAEFSIAGGADIHNDLGRPWVELRYFGEKFRHWSAYIDNEKTIGVEGYITLFDKLDIGLGIEHSEAHSEIVDTEWAYGLRIEYHLNSKWDVGVKHRSNCRTVCDNDAMRFFRLGDDNSMNAGFNYLYLRHRF